MTACVAGPERVPRPAPGSLIAQTRLTIRLESLSSFSETGAQAYRLDHRRIRSPAEPRGECAGPAGPQQACSLPSKTAGRSKTMNQTAEQAGQLALPWLAPKDAARPGRCSVCATFDPRAAHRRPAAGTLAEAWRGRALDARTAGRGAERTRWPGAGRDAPGPLRRPVGLSRAASARTDGAPGRRPGTRRSDQGGAGPGPTSCSARADATSGRRLLRRRGGAAPRQRHGAPGAGAPAGAGARHQEPCAGERGRLPG